MIERTCKRCGQAFPIDPCEQKGRWPVYCSDECAAAVKAERDSDRARTLRAHGICPACKQSLPAK